MSATLLHRAPRSLLLGLAALLSASSAVAEPAVAPPVAEAREWTMGTAAEIRIYDLVRRETAPTALEEAFAELRAVDRLMAVQRRESDVSRMNREAGQRAVAVDPRVVEVLGVARRVSRLTDGAFDVTVLPVVAAWGFLDGPGRRPATAPARPAGWRQVQLDVAHATVRYGARDMGVDLGGVAKGYALDRARAALLDRGVRSAWLDLGGNVATVGVPPDGARWRIGVRDPRRDGALLGVVEVGEASVSTSSDAERFVEDDQGRAGHVIDPRTGAPARALAAATVVAASGALADALSTAALVLGDRRFEAVLARVAGAAVLVDAAATGRPHITVTPGLAFERAPRS